MSASAQRIHDQLLANPPVELLSGIDALYLSAKGQAPGGLLDRLEALRELAKAMDAPVDAALGGYPVKVQPTSFGKYRFCVLHELARIGLTESDHLPVVRFQPTAVALHALGPQGTALWARNFLDACGINATLHVARLDLHSDWQGIDIRANDRVNFVTYSDKRALYEVGEEMSGLTFGKRGGSIVCRIYDKSREFQDKGHDWWRDVWGSKYDPTRKVLRIEFEFSRAGLREFAVDTPEDAFEAMAAMWAYASCEWLTLRVPTDDETRSRWPLDPRWDAVQRSSLAGGRAPAERIREGKRQGDMRQYRKLATGVLSSMAVRMGTHDVGDTLAATVYELLMYERHSGRSFPSRVAIKRQRSAP